MRASSAREHGTPVAPRSAEDEQGPRRAWLERSGPQAVQRPLLNGRSGPSRALTRAEVRGSTVRDRYALPPLSLLSGRALQLQDPAPTNRAGSSPVLAIEPARASKPEDK